MTDILESFNRVIELTGWKYDDQVGLDENEEKEYNDLLEFFRRYFT